MEQSADLSIIIVNWNSTALIEQCLSSVFENRGSYQYDVVVIDNASYDGCEAMLANKFPSVRYIQSDENLGFGKANNRAAATCRSDILLFLNPDTEVIGDALNRLVDHTRKLPKCGAVGGTLLNSDRTLQTSSLLPFPTAFNQLLDCNGLRRVWPRSRLWGMAALFTAPDAPAPVEAISGACLMMPRSAFDAIGGFSPEYFMYSEDTDICYKAHLRGYTNYFVPGVRVVHYGDGSVRKAKSNFAVVMAIESLWRFMAKYRGFAYAVAFRAAIALAAIGRLGLLWAHRGAFCLRRSATTTKASIAKWNSILRWSLMREGWVLKY